jgi:hypothetical protein
MLCSIEVDIEAEILHFHIRVARVFEVEVVAEVLDEVAGCVEGGEERGPGQDLGEEAVDVCLDRFYYDLISTDLIST